MICTKTLFVKKMFRDIKVAFMRKPVAKDIKIACVGNMISESPVAEKEMPHAITEFIFIRSINRFAIIEKSAVVLGEDVGFIHDN